MKLKFWEFSLFVALVLAILWGALLERQQIALAGQMVRLHVVAHSDGVADQMLKHYVRDSVWAEVEPLLAAATCRTEAEATITAHLSQITAAAGATIHDWGADYPVQASLTWERHPTRVYESFTLPAGRYHALRIEIGEARGHNWWCVVFPPLCMEVASGPDALEAAGLTESEVALIAGSDQGYTVRFRALELVDGIRARIGR